jgi:quercetin dioxygenase-like cupin family protein
LPTKPIRAVALVAIGLIFGACGATPAASAPAASAPGPSPAPVVRAILAGGDPAAAPGQRLELARYTIQPHTKLAAHHHPGMQLALIETGTLTYTVISGSVDVHAADGTTRTISAGQTGTINAGEWIAENEQIVHFGENGTDKPLTILASSLFLAGAPPAIVVSPAPSPSPT